MPTSAGIATALTALAGLAAGRIFGIFELYIVAAAMLALVACASAWVLLNWRSLQVSRSVNPSRLHAGTNSTVTLNLSNDRALPTPVARITDEVQGEVRADAQVPPIRRGGSTKASYRLPTERRGRIEIGPMKTKVIDPFGLASASRTSAPDATMLVLPRIDQIAPPPQPGGDLAQRMDRTPNRVGANGDDFSSLRSYVIGDDLRKVHWPSTARSGELVVRTEHVPEHGNSLVLLDVRSTSADADTFEYMVSAAASIVVACRDRGDQVRFVTTSGVDHTAATPAACDVILDLLAEVEQSASMTVKVPLLRGRSSAETGAIIVANDAESLIASVSTSSTSKGGAYVVRFASEGAKPHSAATRLPSELVIDVEHGTDFAITWRKAVRR